MKYLVLIFSIFISLSSRAEQPSAECVGSLAALGGENKAVGYFSFLIKKNYLSSRTVEKLVSGNLLGPKDFEFKNVNASQSLSLLHGVQAAFKDTWLKENWGLVVSNIKGQLGDGQKAQLKVAETKTVTQSIWHQPVRINHELSEISTKGKSLQQLSSGELILITQVGDPLINTAIRQIPIEMSVWSQNGLQILENPSEPMEPFFIQNGPIFFNSRGQRTEIPESRKFEELSNPVIENRIALRTHNGKDIFVEYKKTGFIPGFRKDITQIVDHSTRKILLSFDRMKFLTKFVEEKNSYLIFLDINYQYAYIYDVEKNEIRPFAKTEQIKFGYGGFYYLAQNADIFYFINYIGNDFELIGWNSTSNTVKNFGPGFSHSVISRKLSNGDFVISSQNENKDELAIFNSNIDGVLHYRIAEPLDLLAIEEKEKTVKIISTHKIKNMDYPKYLVFEIYGPNL